LEYGLETQVDKTGHSGSVYGCSWSSDNKSIVTCSSDKTLKTWDADSGKVKDTWVMGKSVGHMQVGVIWTPSTIVSLSLNGTLNIIDPSNTSKWKELHGHHSSIYSLIVDQKNRKFYSCGDETLIEWEFGTSNTRLADGDQPKGIISCIANVGDSIYSCHVDGTIKIVPKESFQFTKEKQKVDGYPIDISVSSNQKLVCVLTAKGITSFIDNKMGSFYEIKGEPQSVSINPNDETQIVVGGKDKKLRVLSLVDGKLKEVKVIDAIQSSIITRVRFSPCGKLLACGDSQKTIKVLDSSDWSVKYTDLLHISSVSDLCFTSDSKYLLSCSLDKDAIVWDLENKKELKVQAHFQGIKCIGLMDDNTFITASEDYCLKSWNFKF